MQYIVHKTAKVPLFQASDFEAAEKADITLVRPESSNHIPKVSLKILHDATSIYGLFHVQDRYVRAVQTAFNGSVCTDSCVEFFFKPDVGPGYFNLEMNAGGAYLLYYVRDCTRTDEGFKDFDAVEWKYGKLLTVKSTLPHVVEPEITEPTEWEVMFTIPIAALEPYTGKIGTLNNRTWSCNFYKCGDLTSHPHWLTWAPISATNFHLPQHFQPMILE